MPRFSDEWMDDVIGRLTQSLADETEHANRRLTALGRSMIAEGQKDPAIIASRYETVCRETGFLAESCADEKQQFIDDVIAYNDVEDFVVEFTLSVEG